jgi:hypothetical protein
MLSGGQVGHVQARSLSCPKKGSTERASKIPVSERRSEKLANSPDDKVMKKPHPEKVESLADDWTADRSVVLPSLDWTEANFASSAELDVQASLDTAGRRPATHE